MHHSNGLVEIKHSSRLDGNEVFVLAQQCPQVYYTCLPDNKSLEWWTAIKTTTRSHYNIDMSEFIEDTNNMKSFYVDQSEEISQPCCVLSNLTFDDPSILAKVSYYKEIDQHEMLQLETNWGEEVERALICSTTFKISIHN